EEWAENHGTRDQSPAAMSLRRQLPPPRTSPGSPRAAGRPRGPRRAWVDEVARSMTERSRGREAVEEGRRPRGGGDQGGGGRGGPARRHEATPRAPARAHLPLLPSSPGGVQQDDTARGVCSSVTAPRPPPRTPARDPAHD